MSHNIRDRNDFYEKLFKYFTQLSDKKYEYVFSATITLIVGLLETYIKSKQSDTDELKKFLFLLWQKIVVDTHNGVQNQKMLEDISVYIDRIKDSRRKKDEKQDAIIRTIKPGAESIFIQFSELEDIGTSEEYSAYLDNIFPESKVKDIVYYGTNTKVSFFDERLLGNSIDTETAGLGYYINTKPPKNNARYVIPVMIDARTSLIGLRYTILDFGDVIKKRWRKSNEIVIHKEQIYTSNDFEKEFVRHALYRIGNKKIISYKDLSTIFSLVIKSFGFDSLKFHSSMFNDDEIVVFEKEQVHVLGSKQDIEMFKMFVAKQRSNIRTGLTA